MEDGLACVRKGRPFPIADGVWLIATDLRTLTSYGNHCLLIKDEETHSMTAVNLVKLTRDELMEVRSLCDFEGVQMKHLICTSDHHHLFVTQWQWQFDATLYVPSERVLSKMDPTERNFESKNVVLDLEAPAIKGLAGTVQLLPVLGTKKPGVIWETPRAELVVYHPKSGILFVTDHLYALGRRLFVRKAPSVAPSSFQFRIMDRVAARASAERVLALAGIAKIIFAHGSPTDGAVQSTDVYEKLRVAYRHFTVDPKEEKEAKKMAQKAQREEAAAAAAAAAGN